MLNTPVANSQNMQVMVTAKVINRGMSNPESCQTRKKSHLVRVSAQVNMEHCMHGMPFKFTMCIPPRQWYPAPL